MATADDGISPSESGGAGEKSRKTPMRTENPGGMSSDEGGNSGIRELEQMSKQVSVTRFKFKHPATMEDLPDELLSNIFIRLLARQLAQMRSVSKSWNGLLSHPSFVQSHLHRSIHTNNEQILLVFPPFEPFIEYSCESPHLEQTTFITHIPPSLPMDRVIGSVNGLICLSDNSYSNIHIWNPSLSAVSTIPQPPFITCTYPYINYIRFGFDPKTDDYKLVKISANYCSVKEWLPIEVYSMRKGCWEFVTQPFPSHITSIHPADKLCVDGHDGHLHWQNQTGPLREHTILAYDLGSETFHEMPLPDAILDSNHGSHLLGVLNGKLCEMTRRKNGEWEVWVMEEYGVPESWAKCCLVFPHFYGDRTFPYGFISRNKLLFGDEDDRLLLYDPIVDKTKSTRTKQQVRKVVEYVDSLVWIKEN